MQKSITITWSSPDCKENAQQFARRNKFAVTDLDNITTPLALNFTPEYIELLKPGHKLRLHVDFTSGELAHRQKYGGGRGQAIAKAIGLKPGTEPPALLDCTAGLAKDAFVFACMGCHVTMLERSPVLAAMIEDGIARASDNEQFRGIIKNGFSLIQQDSIEYLNRLDEQPDSNPPDVIYPDVIYLDPMYPERKKSASIKKNMQLLQQLVGKDDDTAMLLQSALRHAKKRVVVKRPKGAPTLTSLSPTMTVESKKTRYDIYVISALK